MPHGCKQLQTGGEMSSQAKKRWRCHRAYDHILKPYWSPRHGFCVPEGTSDLGLSAAALAFWTQKPTREKGATSPVCMCWITQRRLMEEAEAAPHPKSHVGQMQSDLQEEADWAAGNPCWIWSQLVVYFHPLSNGQIRALEQVPGPAPCQWRGSEWPLTAKACLREGRGEKQSNCLPSHPLLHTPNNLRNPISRLHCRFSICRMYFGKPWMPSFYCVL